MSVELVTGYFGVDSEGKPNRHVSSAEDGARQAGTLGPGCYVLSTGSKLSATMEDANTLVVADGDAVMNGRHVRLTETTSFTIPTGVQGQKVSNVAVLRYQVGSDSVESVTPLVLTGEPSTGEPTDPEHNEGSILDGDSPVDFPLYRVVTDGINAGDPEPLFDVLMPMADLWDSVSQNATDVVALGKTVDVKQSQSWSNIELTAFERAGTVTVTVTRVGMGSPSVPNDEPSAVGTIKAGHRPSRTYRQLIGTQGGTWLLMQVTPAGAVQLVTYYASEWTSWGQFSGTLSYPVP